MEQAIVIDNVDTVKKRVGNTGFGNRFDNDIDQALAAGKTEMRFFTSEVIENKKMDFEPEIKVNESKGYYNGYKATLHNEDGTTVEHWFKASDRITINEAYILMMDQQHPRAVYKTYYDEKGEKYGQWLQFDFTQKTENGNYLTKRFNDYDLVGKLNDFAFVGLSSEKQRITAAAYMAEGREIAVTPVNQENYPQVFVRANPERGTITIMDEGGKPLYHDQFRTEEARQRVQQEKNTRQSTVSLVKDSRQEQTDGMAGSLPENTDTLKKKNNTEPAESLTPNKRPRVLLEEEIKKGKSI